MDISKAEQNEFSVKDFTLVTSDVIERIQSANKMTNETKHSMISNGCAHHVKSNLTYLTKDEANVALNLKIKIGYADSVEDLHGTWEDYYSYYSINSPERIKSCNSRISIDPAYDLAKSIYGTKDLKLIIQNINMLEKMNEMQSLVDVLHEVQYEMEEEM